MNHLSPNVAHKLKCFVRWMTHEDRHYELHDDFLATLTRDNYLKFRHMDSQSFKSFSASSPSHHELYKHQVKKRPQRKAFFSQQEEISDDDEYANVEEQFSTDPGPEEYSPYSVDQSSSHPKMPQKSFLPPNIWETPSESTKQKIIEHNKKVKFNNPTPYPSGSKTKPNPTLGKPTPAPQQVHQHSQDEPTEEPPPDTSTQTLVNKCLAESGIDPTDIQNVMPVSYVKRNISSHESSRKIQAHQVFVRVNHSQYPILMKQNCTNNPSTSQISKSYHHNPVTFPYPPDPGETLTDDTNTIIIRSAVRSTTKTSPNLRLDPPKGRINPKISHLMCLFMAGPILMDLITPHPCPSSILITYWGEPSSYLWMRMGRERGLPFLSMSRISVNNMSQENISSDSSSRLMETNMMTSFHMTNLWNT